MSAAEWWRNAAVYEIYIRSFCDSNGDGIGDLNGIRQKLPYLSALGVDAIWITPFFQSPGVDNGYDISDYLAIDPQYGTMDDFRLLLSEAHERGIRVVLDMVLNHTSSLHPWFRESRVSGASGKRDWYIWRKSPNNWGSQFGGSAWHFDEESGEYYLGLFSAAQPDLNWHNPAVRSAVKEVLRFWAELGVDGFRLDVISLIAKPESFPDGPVNESGYADFHPFVANNPLVHDYLRELNDAVFAPYALFTVGEASGVTLDEARKYCAADRHELSTVFSFEHVGLDGSEEYKWTDRSIDREELKRVLFRWQTGAEGFFPNALFWCNHDQPRIVSRLGDKSTQRERSAKMLAAALYGMRGVAFVYQGQELGMLGGGFTSRTELRDIESLQGYDALCLSGLTDAESMAIVSAKTRDNARTPMQWSAGRNAGFSSGEPWIKPGEGAESINAKDQTQRVDSVFSFYRKLLSLRRENPCLARGRLIPCEDRKGVLAYERRREGKGVLVVCNLTAEEQCCPCPDGYADGSVLLSNCPGSCYAADGRLMPYECAIIEKSYQEDEDMTLLEAVGENRLDQKRREEERMKNGRSELYRDGLREVYDIFYLPDGSSRHTLDLIRPEGKETLPVIIEIHGGGYIACEKNINRLHARWFAQQGFAVVNGDYTLHPEADFVAELREIAAIVDWVADNAERCGLDVGRVYMSGDSAGGHLVLLYAMLQGNREFQGKIHVMPGRCEIKAAAPTCPAFSLSGGGVAGAALATLIPLMYPEGVEPSYLETFNVLRLIPESEYPPLIVTTTPADELLYEEDRILEKALAERGRPYRFCAWPEKTNRLGHVFNVLFPELEESEKANRAIVDFFLTHS